VKAAKKLAQVEAKLADLELDRVSLRADLRETSARVDALLEERDVFVAMLLRAAREMSEPILRAGFLEELEAMVPGALDEVPADDRPDALRKRAAK
jgi:hypothetical protein